MELRLLLAVAIPCTACLDGTAHPTAPPTADAHLGVAAAFPSTWSVVWRPCSDCVDPRTVFVAASFPLSGGFQRMMCRRIPDGGAVMSLAEIRPGIDGGAPPSRADFPPRPASFQLDPLLRLGAMTSCNQLRAHLLRFRDSGRVLYAWATFGPHPSHAIAHARAVLDSLRVAPLHSQG